MPSKNPPRMTFHHMHRLITAAGGDKLRGTIERVQSLARKLPRAEGDAVRDVLSAIHSIGAGVIAREPPDVLDLLAVEAMRDAEVMDLARDPKGIVQRIAAAGVRAFVIPTMIRRERRLAAGYQRARREVHGLEATNATLESEREIVERLCQMVHAGDVVTVERIRALLAGNPGSEEDAQQAIEFDAELSERISVEALTPPEPLVAAKPVAIDAAPIAAAVAAKDGDKLVEVAIQPHAIGGELGVEPPLEIAPPERGEIQHRYQPPPGFQGPGLTEDACTVADCGRPWREHALGVGADDWSYGQPAPVAARTWPVDADARHRAKAREDIKTRVLEYVGPIMYMWNSADRAQVTEGVIRPWSAAATSYAGTVALEHRLERSDVVITLQIVEVDQRMPAPDPRELHVLFGGPLFSESAS